MEARDSSVDLLAQAILAQAEAEAKKIKETAEAAAERLVEEAEQEAGRLREAAALAEAARVERESASALAAARLKARRKLLDAREELIGQVFAEAATRLESLRKDASYPRILVKLVHEAVATLEGEHFFVAVMPEDHDLAAQALNSVPSEGKRIEVRADEEVHGGGCVVWQSDRRAFHDSTFRSIIARHRLRLRALVAEALWGKGSRWEEL